MSGTAASSTSTDEPPQPCFLSAALGAIPAGLIGWFFGLIPSMARNRSFAAASRALWISDANLSAVNLAKFSGAYGLSHCIITRIRQVDDALNRGVAGCATGIAIGWPGGPASMFQSCVAIGLISYIVDFGGSSEPLAAKAGPRLCCGGCLAGRGCSGSPEISSVESSSTNSGDDAQHHSHGHHHHHHAHPSHNLDQANRRPSKLSSLTAATLMGIRREASRRASKADFGISAHLSLPPVMWLGAISNGAYFQGQIQLEDF